MHKVEQAIVDLRQGKMILLLDDEGRENEGDLLKAGECITADDIVFMLQSTCGIICLAMSAAHCERLRIPMMTSENRSNQTTPFGVSFEAADGITTGVSASDRAKSIRVAANPNATPTDIVMPGHIFPLRANSKGVFARRGHTEGSVDLMRLAGLTEAAVICEVMNADGSMAKGEQLTEFARRHRLSMITIDDIHAYRLQRENWLKPVATSQLPTKHGHFTATVFRSEVDGAEHVALCSRRDMELPLVRIHSACLTGDALGSTRCDCGLQLEEALATIAREGGVLLYCEQEGRGIGLVNKIKAYALQDKGKDTVEANYDLGFLADCREYSMAAQMLRYFGWKKIRLMTNNPHKIESMRVQGIDVVNRVSLEMAPTDQSLHYLRTKRDKLGHLLNLKDTIC